MIFIHSTAKLRPFIFLSVLFSTVRPVGAAEPTNAPRERSDVTLELIMSDLDWIGRPPERPYWADDGHSFYYFQKREGAEERDLIHFDLKTGAPAVVADKDRGAADAPGAVYSADRKQKVYSREGDIYLKDLRSGKVRQLTRTREAETDPGFMANPSRIYFLRGNSIFVREVESGLEYEPADLRLEKDPDEKKDDADFLKREQERLFQSLQEKKKREETAKSRSRAEQEADRMRAPLPWYLGDKVSIRGSAFSPSGDWLIVRLAPKEADGGKHDAMPNYVTESGYVSTREVRIKVGTGKEEGERLLLLDLNKHEKHEIDLSNLPGIMDDPLKELREKAEAARKAAEAKAKSAEKKDGKTADEKKKDEKSDEKTGEKPGEKKPTPRPIVVTDILWNEDGSRVALQLFSLDHKDRWIALLDLAANKLIPVEHMSDAAWVNRYFTELGWMRDGKTLYFLSEDSGYSHLYRRGIEDGAKRALTSGDYEVTEVKLSGDDRDFYYTANAEHPGIREIYRVSAVTGKIEQLTKLGGQNRYVLSPDETRMLVIHSSTTHPPEIYVQSARPGAPARQLTHTTSEKFASIEWIEPKVVAIPSSHDARSIYSRLYQPPSAASGAKRPAVFFVHGAGYLQDAHLGWSSYAHEFMFQTLLARAGYVVLDMDYRGSAGYGRDWRTAIYRQMGGPELEDLKDGVKWLAENANVDPKRVGLYGGSYGGFLTLMALFKEPNLFACGAALRPVTDWAHYNHPYTSEILNIPSVDPESYERSSPIEFAAGLAKPLLVCHGMQDDNVLFQDTVRLTQRLIELKKENWETAFYPVESHAFKESVSWLDEYRRIFGIFERYLKN